MGRRSSQLALAALCPGLLALAAAAPAAADTCTVADLPDASQARRMYRWSRRNEVYESMACRIAAPGGFKRVAAPRGSFAHWLRHLPLRSPTTPVRSFEGKVILPVDSPHLVAVVDMDVGKRDLQQCADTLMRLRGEYHFQRGRPDRTRFRWAGGKRFGYRHWRKGLRPVKHGRRWVFEARARPGRGYGSFRRYLRHMFIWTGTLHLMGEPRVRTPAKVRIGDFFIQGGSPGHAVMVLDLARSAEGRTVALLGQGFMPAQDLHVLRAHSRKAWFELDPGQKQIQTPLWRPFTYKDLRRFRY